jgi:hypothetical protein
MERIVAYTEANGNEGFTYKEIGIHYNTLGALVKRGYLSKDGSKYYLEPRGYLFTRIKALAESREYFVLRKEGTTIGMMCSIKGNDILDCYENVYSFDSGLYFKHCMKDAKEEFIG